MEMQFQTKALLVLLLEAAKKYHSLSGSKLIITLGKKETLSEIIVDFQVSATSIEDYH